MRALASVAVLLTVSCKETVSPAPFRIDLTASALEAPEVFTTAQGVQAIACGVEFTAEAFGGGRILWDQAVFRFYAGHERLLFDSVTVSASEVARLWGADGLVSGEQLSSRWNFAADVPFTLSANFSYLPDGSGKAGIITTSFNCGPTPGTATTPTVEIDYVDPPGGPLEPGRNLSVRYTSQSSIGLWQSALVLSGACSVVVVRNEGLTKISTQIITIRIPLECQIGQPLEISVHVLDAALLKTVRSAGVRTIADVTAPQVSVGATLPGGYEAPLTTAELFVGQSLQLHFTATDNLGLRMLTWEIPTLGVRDSFPVTGTGATRSVTIPLPAGTEGAHELRVWARDASGLESIRYVSPPGAIRVYPTVERLQATMTITGRVDDFLIDPKRNMLYLRQRDLNRIVFVAMATRSVTRTVQFASAPVDMDITVGGDSLIVLPAGARAVHFVNLADPATPVGVVPLTILDPALNHHPDRVRATSSGKAMIVISGYPESSWRLAELDFASGAQRFRNDANLNNVIEVLLGRSPDHSVILLNHKGALRRYDVRTDQIGPFRPMDSYDITPSMTTDGSLTAVGVNILDAALLFLRKAQVPGADQRAALSVMSPAGDYLYVWAPNAGIVRVRVSDGRIVDRTPATANPVIMRVSADGALLAYLSGTLLVWMDPR